MVDTVHNVAFEPAVYAVRRFCSCALHYFLVTLRMMLKNRLQCILILVSHVDGESYLLNAIPEMRTLSVWRKGEPL